MVTMTTKPPVTLQQPVVVTSNKGNPSSQVLKAAPIGQGKKISDKGKHVKPPKKGKKNVVKALASNATTSAGPSSNLRSKLHDKAKFTAAMIQEIMEELQAIEEESSKDGHDSEAPQESDLEWEDSKNYLTDDEQWLFKIQDLPFLTVDQNELDNSPDKTEAISNILKDLNQDINHKEEVVIGSEQGTTFPAKIGTLVCNALIDSGATRNCISKRILSKFIVNKKPIHAEYQCKISHW